MLLSVYSESIKNGQSLVDLDEMDFLYFLDILIYTKYTSKADDEGVYGDTISL